jgi:hypothetical protein
METGGQSRGIEKRSGYVVIGKMACHNTAWHLLSSAYYTKLDYLGKS